jgi:hypothetical protein
MIIFPNQSQKRALKLLFSEISLNKRDILFRRISSLPGINQTDMNSPYIIFLVTALLMAGCRNNSTRNMKESDKTNYDSTAQYGYNRDFLRKYTEIIELKQNRSALVIVPAWQGRVMTSTAGGDKGYSFGRINRELIASGITQKHINPFGGEERLWLGPEGGQFSIFFGKGSEFTFEKWQTPDFLDTKPYELISSDDTSASFRTTVSFENYSGTRFELDIARKVTLLSVERLERMTGIKSVTECVAYLSENTIRNSGNESWKKETGLISVWMLGMFNPSPSVVIVIPVREGDEKKYGVKVNDNYFGKISADRLRTVGNIIFFRADGKSRGKIGIPPLRTSGVMGSYDSQNNILTLLFCKLPEGFTDYVNSAWKLQEDPYSGDAFNSYNDGPLEDGSQMGPFYELETSSPAAALTPGQSLLHSQVTVHLTGNRKMLDEVALKVLGCSLETIEGAFK